MSEETARLVAEALSREGVAAAVAEDTWSALPPPATTNNFVATDDVLVLGREDTLVTYHWPAVAAVTAGIARRSSLKLTGFVRDPTDWSRDAQHRLVDSEEAIVDIVLLEPLRRIRFMLSRAVFGEEERGRDHMQLLRARLADVARAIPRATAAGRGVLACADGRALPRYRSMRDLEREESWLLWRHHGPGARLLE